MYPEYEAIVALHNKHATDETAFDLIFTHSLIIKDIALSIISTKSLKDVDIELVETGALLHDIGTYSLYAEGCFDKKNYITHGIRGYEILRKEGYPEQLCRIASNHTGMGITKKEIIHRGLPLPTDDYVANTIEEKLVMYADKFHSKTPRFNTSESYRKFSEQFGPNVTERFDAMIKEFGLPDLNYFARKYKHPIV